MWRGHLEGGQLAVQQMLTPTQGKVKSITTQRGHDRSLQRDRVSL